MTLQKKIESQSLKEVSWYKKGPGEAIPVPVLGPDLIDLRKIALIREKSRPVADLKAETASAVEASQDGELPAKEEQND
jgi:NADH-quinone oxidoreductase subunit B